MGAAEDSANLTHKSHLFVLRLWPEDMGGGKVDWRGSVRHVNSGQVHYYRDWAMLRAFVDEMLGVSDDAAATVAGDRQERPTG